MDNKIEFLKNTFNLLVVIANYGQGSKIINFAKAKGANGATCILGKGAIQNELLDRLGLTAVKKEIVFIVLPFGKDEQVLANLSEKFHFDKPNHGIAFTLSLSSVLGYFNKEDEKNQLDTLSVPVKEEQPVSEYTLLISIVDRRCTSDVIEAAQNNGFQSGTIIDAHCFGNIFNFVVQPEKDVILQLVSSDKSSVLEGILSELFTLSEPYKGFLVTVPVKHVIGLY